MCGEHEGFTLWFTGLPCSGKSAVGDRVAEILKEKGHRVERLDGDVVRQDLTRDLGFSKKDRDENIRRVTFVAKLLSRNGVAVLTSFISPYREMRDRARKEPTAAEIVLETDKETIDESVAKVFRRLGELGLL